MFYTKKILRFSVFLILLSLTSCWGENKKSPTKIATTDKKTETTINAVTKIKTIQEFNEIKSPKVVKFFATWCGPCQIMKPIFEAFAQKHAGKGITFAEIDIDNKNTKELVGQYVNQGVPTTVFFDKEGKIETLVGGKNLKALETSLKKIM